MRMRFATFAATIAAAVAVLLAVVVAPRVQGAKANKRTSAAPRAVGQKNATAPIVPDDPVPAWLVEPEPGHEGAELVQHKAMAARLNRVKPFPAERADHFVWLDGRDDFLVRGWHGFIEAVDPAPDGGSLVRIRVTPYVKSTHGSTSAVTAWTRETYHVTADGLELVGVTRHGGPGVIGH